MIDGLDSSSLDHLANAATTTGNTVIKELIKQSIGKILNHEWKKGTESGKDFLNQLTTDSGALTYYDRLAKEIVHVRTISTPEVDTHIDAIYTPLKLTRKSATDITVIRDGFRLHPQLPINIIGNAGQGKSTILRKLFWEELKEGKTLPIFIELSRLRDHTIENYILKQFQELGFSVTEEDISYILQSRRAILLLDGFDEVPFDLRNRTLELIKNIYVRYHAKVITTSRLDTEICRAPNFSNMEVLPLEKDDISQIIEKVETNAEKRQQLFECLKQDPSIQETLISPILVFLFCVTQPHWEYVPKNATGFYKQLFNLMFSRHDLLKNLDRPKKSSVAQSRMEELFSAFCYYSFINEDTVFDRTSLSSYFGEALEYFEMGNDELDKIIDDIIDVTCLVMKDGHETYVFAHRSIQEYHAAHFLSHSIPTESVEPLFDDLIQLFSSSEYLDQLLIFLSAINLHTFEKHFVLRAFEKCGMGAEFAGITLENSNLLPFENELKYSISKHEQTITLPRACFPTPLLIEEVFYTPEDSRGFIERFEDLILDLKTQIITIPLGPEPDKEKIDRVLKPLASEVEGNTYKITVNKLLQESGKSEEKITEISKLLLLTHNSIYIEIDQRVKRKSSLLRLRPLKAKG